MDLSNDSFYYWDPLICDLYKLGNIWPLTIPKFIYTLPPEPVPLFLICILGSFRTQSFFEADIFAGLSFT